MFQPHVASSGCNLWSKNLDCSSPGASHPNVNARGRVSPPSTRHPRSQSSSQTSSPRVRRFHPRTLSSIRPLRILAWSSSRHADDVGLRPGLGLKSARCASIAPDAIIFCAIPWIRPIRLTTTIARPRRAHRRRPRTRAVPACRRIARATSAATRSPSRSPTSLTFASVSLAPRRGRRVDGPFVVEADPVVASGPSEMNLSLGGRDGRSSAARGSPSAFARAFRRDRKTRRRRARRAKTRAKTRTRGGARSSGHWPLRVGTTRDDARMSRRARALALALALACATGDRRSRVLARACAAGNGASDA